MTQRTQGKDWPSRLTAVIAGEVRRHRSERGISAQQLSDRCAEIGFPIPRAVLANLENGRRTNVGIAELFVLAQALGVPPVALVCPVGYEEQMEYLPGEMEDPFEVRNWIAGEAAQDKEKLERLESSALGKTVSYYYVMRQTHVLGMEFERARERYRALSPEELQAGKLAESLWEEIRPLEKEAQFGTNAGRRARESLGKLYGMYSTSITASGSYRAIVGTYRSALEDYMDAFDETDEVRRRIEGEGFFVGDVPDQLKLWHSMALEDKDV